MRRRRAVNLVGAAAVATTAVGAPAVLAATPAAAAADRAFEGTPPEGRVAAGGVWSGSSLVVWGGSTTTGPLTFATTALVYDLEEGTWRETAPAPIVERLRPQLVWTGREVVVVGGQAARLTGDPAVAALDPATGTWRTVGTLPDWVGQVAAVAWTGEAVVVIGGEPDRPGRPARSRDG
jgi:hypothetical protein